MQGLCTGGQGELSKQGCRGACCCFWAAASLSDEDSPPDRQESGEEPGRGAALREGRMGEAAPRLAERRAPSQTRGVRPWERGAPIQRPC